MSRGNVCDVCVGLALVLAASSAKAAVIDVGTHYLLPDTPDQTIAIYVQGTEQIAGMDFNVQVANGGPELEGMVLQPGEGIDGPDITDVDLVTGLPGISPTIFGAVPHSATHSEGIVPQEWVAMVICGEVHGMVAANGLLGTVTFDTRGWRSGSWDLFLSTTHNGPTALIELIDNNVHIPQPIPVDWTDGRIVIASGRSVVTGGDFAGGTLDDWTVAGEGTAELVEFPVGSGNLAVQLTAGSEVVLGQTIDTPAVGFLASFDYALLSAGSLELMLGGESLGRIEVEQPGKSGEFRLARFQVDDPQLFGLADTQLALHFTGESGAELVVDNISLRAVPEPTALTLLLGLLALAPWPLVLQWRGG